MGQSNQLMQVLDEAHKQRKTGRFLFLTLTAENASGENLKQEVRKMGRAISKLFQYKKPAKNLLGYVRSTEITINKMGLIISTCTCCFSLNQRILKIQQIILIRQSGQNFGNGL
ncbi:hypothetical protein N624_2755 [Levilactobacillus brevis]|nr:hypothetical protein N624_2755 [Levilactobacillus brevis]